MSPRLGYEGACVWDSHRRLLVRYGGHNQGGGGEQGAEDWLTGEHSGPGEPTIVDLGELRHDFRELDATDARVDGAELTADIGRDIGLRVPKVEVARPALEIKEDNALGPPPAGAAALMVFLGMGLLLEQAAQRGSEQARAADARLLGGPARQSAQGRPPAGRRPKRHRSQSP